MDSAVPRSPTPEEILSSLEPAIADQLRARIQASSGTVPVQAPIPTVAVQAPPVQAIPPIPMAAEPMAVPVALPSAGRVYDETVMIRPMITKEIKVLSQIDQAGSLDRMLTEILRSTIKRGPAPEKLLYWDRLFLLVWLRVNSYRDGHVYTPAFACPFCAHEQTVGLDLRELEVKKLSEEYREPFEVVLDDASHITLALRLTRGEDEDAVESYLSKHAGEDEWFVRYAVATVSVNGFGYPIDSKIEMLKSLTVADFMKVRATVDKFAFGLDLTINPTCSNPECGRSLSLLVPFQGEFFLPQT